ncbi:hypothetical protein [Nonomuraea bangladeshensis]|uniref:hypothetical protein n=1 Tax=Nonomuraea bangladeshensis TaxID=404385 RepID=UPI003C2F0864
MIHKGTALQAKLIGLQSVPPETYPHIVEMAVPLVEGPDPALYDTFGVDLVLAGIEALAGRRLGSSS